MDRYQNPNCTIDQRVQDLLSRMTLEEKVLQTDQYFSHDFTLRDENGVVTSVDMEKLHEALKGKSVGSIQLRGMTAAKANQIQRYAMERTRLGIPFLFSEEALHGLMNRDATCFPQQLGLVATFNPALGKAMGRAIATEARANGIHETYSPVMDLIRDPRYGRTEESYGEDVHLCACFARETVKGLQGESLSAPDAVAAEPKHYVGYGNPVGGLNCAPSTMGRHDVFAACLPVFEAAYVDGGAVNAMCSYNAIDGVPVSMDRELLTDVLRGQFGMEGFVRTDLTAVSRLYDWHFITPSKKEAIRLGLEAGVDLQLYDFPHQVWQDSIIQLVQDGELSKETLDQACARVLRVKFMLGLFDQPYTDESRADIFINCQAHKDTALQIARESMCLLKNDNQLLPLKKDMKNIAVLGPAAAQPSLGDYTANPDPNRMVSLLDGVRAMVSPKTNIVYQRGCSFLGDTITPFHKGMLLSDEGNAGLTARYYNNLTFEGAPVAIREDLSINFNWIYANPHPGVEANNFSVVWTGYVAMENSFQGCIGLSSQDSMRLYVDGALLVDGFGEGNSADKMVDFLFEAGKRYAIRIEYISDMRGARVIFGYNSGKEDYTNAIKAAKEADVAIVCLGDNEETSGENFDRVDLHLPGCQLEFLKTMYATGTPIVLVMQSGRPVTACWEQEHIPAILEAWFPGEMGGQAIGEILFGDQSPSGRLPITFPRAVGQIPCHYSRLPGGGKRYVEMDWLPLYPFGYGLSYTTFAYSALTLSKAQISPGETITISLNVTNTGNRQGIAVPQVYLRDCFSSTVKPRKELAGFQKISLQPGETKRVDIPLDKRMLRTLGQDFIWRTEPGEFLVMVGDNAENELLTSKFYVVI